LPDNPVFREQKESLELEEGFPLRIGINALFMIPGGVGGSEIYMRCLVKALAAADTHNHYFLFRNAETGPDFIPAGENFFDCPQRVHATSRPARIAFEQTQLLLQIKQLKLDLIFNGGFTAPILCTIPMITVFYDLQYKVHPQYARWFDRPFWDLILPASARRSERLVTLSASAKADIERFYPWATGHIDVIPPGVEPEFRNIAIRRDASHAETKIILTVSTLHPHKNLDNLMRAFMCFSERNGGYRLIVCGLKGFETERLLKLRKELGLENQVEFTGWISRDELHGHFENADAFIYPSRFEGFGIPVLEALTAGVPLACSDIAPLREIAGACASYFDPDDVDAMAAALEKITCNGRSRSLTREGQVLATHFSWSDSARRLRSIFESAAIRHS